MINATEIMLVVRRPRASVPGAAPQGAVYSTLSW
jgi:hypothetical protein